MKRSAKLLFLDFDGVIIHWDYFLKISPQERDKNGPESIDSAAIARLNRIIVDTGALIVVTSIWRQSRSRTQLSELLHAKGFLGCVLGKTPHISGSHQRGAEIKAYLEDIGRFYSVTRYAVVDDDFDAGLGHEDVFVRTRMQDGLTDAHAVRLVEILNAT